MVHSIRPVSSLAHFQVRQDCSLSLYFAGQYCHFSNTINTWRCTIVILPSTELQLGKIRQKCKKKFHLSTPDRLFGKLLSPMRTFKSFSGVGIEKFETPYIYTLVFLYTHPDWMTHFDFSVRFGF